MVLVVEDDEIIAEGLKLALQQEGYQVILAGNQADAMKILGQEGNQVEICLLDITLPDGNGYEICSFIRAYSDMPILFLTACDDEIHAVLALEQGADDYIAKPFHMRELFARIKAIQRRMNIRQESKNIQIGDNEINLQTAKMYRGGKEVVLTAMEYKLLLIFIKNRGNVLSRRQILDILWDDVGDFVNDNTLTVYIKRLRKKLDDPDGQWIETLRGLGYRLRSQT